MRYLFPQDRLVFRYGAPGTPLYSPQGETITIYTDQAATTPANLQDPSGNAIDSTLAIGVDCLIPEFKGPDGVTVVWAKNRVGAVEPLYAQTGQFLMVPGPATPVTGSRASGAALTSLLSVLAAKGIIIDQTTA